MCQILRRGSSENQILLQQGKLLREKNQTNRKAAFGLFEALSLENVSTVDYFKTIDDDTAI